MVKTHTKLHLNKYHTTNVITSDWDSNVITSSEFYEVCKGLDLGRGFKFPTLEQVQIISYWVQLFSVMACCWTLQMCMVLCYTYILFLWIKLLDEQPPASFVSAMEEYVKDAPRSSSVRRELVWTSILREYIVFWGHPNCILFVISKVPFNFLIIISVLKKY